MFKGTTNLDIEGFSDANWANNVEDRKSIMGSVFLSSNCSIAWTSKKQSTVALSTVEVEYVALSYTCQEAIWFREFIKEIAGEPEGKVIKVFCDNNGAICVAKNRVTSAKTKHIDTKHHFIREKIENNIVSIEYLNG